MHIFAHFRVDHFFYSGILIRMNDLIRDHVYEFRGRWGSPVEIETRRRIKVSLWAYAYEFRAHTIVPDFVYDVEAYQINLAIDTGRPDLDWWFRAMFKPYTGMWIHSHPELEKIAGLYDKFYSNQA